MGLQRIQDALCGLYRVVVDQRVEDYLCDADTIEAVAGDECLRGEVLVIAEDEEGEGAAIGLYVAADAIADVADGGDVWLDGRLQSACLATEGVSHFVYVMFRATEDHSVSQLELELQAEVDKYASATLGSVDPYAPLTGLGVGAIRTAAMRERSRVVRDRLFASVTFLDEGGTEAGERYRLAHRAGARFAAHLEAHYLDEGDFQGWLRALRRFYRAGLRGKLEQPRR
jgi:hypothetical protein